jgi:hypothetical protein
MNGRSASGDGFYLDGASGRKKAVNGKRLL